MGYCGSDSTVNGYDENDNTEEKTHSGNLPKVFEVQTADLHAKRKAYMSRFRQRDMKEVPVASFGNDS